MILREKDVFPYRGIKKMKSRAALVTIKNPGRGGRAREIEKEKKRGGERKGESERKRG